MEADVLAGINQVVGWGSLSLIIAGIAQGKNRSGFAWWVAGVFLGPVALFFLVIFFDKIQEKEDL